MKTSKLNFEWGKPLGISLAAGTLAITTLLVSTSTAQAQPRPQAPAYGYPGSNQQNVTLVGTVTSELRNNQFEFRADDGRTYRAEFDNRAQAPRTLAVGQRVSVTGSLRGINMAVREVRVLNRGDDRGNWGNRVTLNGTVTRELRDDQFEFRADDGRTYRAEFTDRVRAPRSIRVGERVSVTGTVQGSNMAVTDFRVLSGAGTTVGNRVTLTGTVTRNLNAEQFEFRADNNIVYRGEFVNRSQTTQNLAVGDHVSVYGDAQGTNIAVLNVRVIQSNTGGFPGTYPGGYPGGYPNPSYPGYPGGYPAPGYPPTSGTGVNTTLTGTVIRDLNADQFELRGDDGRTYRVEFYDRSQRPVGLAAGDRVSVFGNVQGNNVGASNVRIVQKGTGVWNDNVGARSVNFPATVTLVRSPTSLVVRGDNGRDYEVAIRLYSRQTVTAGDRVRVIGQANGDIVNAEELVRLTGTDVYQGGYGQGGYGNDGYGQAGNVVVLGTVESSSLSSFRIRADDGRTYEVRYRASLLMRRGQRVRVEGTFNGNVIEARDVNNL